MRQAASPELFRVRMGWRVMCRLTSSQLLSLQEIKSQSQMLSPHEEGDQSGGQPKAFWATPPGNPYQVQQQAHR